MFYIQRCSIFSKIDFAVKITDINGDVCNIHSDLRSGIICFISFYFYFCMVFSFSFLFFKRSMQIPIKIPTGSIQDKEIEYFTFSYIHGAWLFILWFHCGFCNKKGTFKVFTGVGHLQTSETSGRNFTVELNSRHPLLPKTGWGEMKI